ncbi:MAG: hypothetical protein ACRC6V_14695 [Bacteroidales bacterium]
MVKKKAVSIPTFSPNQTLKSIRQDSLNPVIQRMFAVENLIDTEIVPAVKTVYNDVLFDQTTSKMTFQRVGRHDPLAPEPDTVIDLSSIIPQYAGIDVKGGTGEVKNTNKVSFDDATVTKNGDDYANVTYNWTDLVLKHQLYIGARINSSHTYDDFSEVDITGDGRKYFKVVGATPTIPGKLTIDLPEIPDPLQGSVTGKASAISTVKAIKVTGNVGGSIISPDGVLEIDLPSGGGTGFSVGYFQGFFNGIDDLNNLSPTSLQPDKSSAYVMTSIVGAVVYVLYMYKGPTADPKWIPVVTKPPLIYEGPIGGQNQAVISIKNNSDITVSSNGVLNLDKLKNPDTQSNYFMGTFKTLDEIRAIENPTEDKSYAILYDGKTKTFIPYSYRTETGSSNPAWGMTPLRGSLAAMGGTGTTMENAKPIYGIKAAGAVLSDRGVLDLSKATTRGSISAIVTDASAGTERGDIRTLKFQRMEGDIDFKDGQTSLTMHPAQRNIAKVDKAWMDLNSTDNHLGKIYYDVSTGKWMGMTTKNTTAEEPKWTPIAHRNMSEEVSGLSYRHPAKSPKVLPNVTAGTEDSERWFYSGTTWVEAGDASAPKELESKCGGFIKTDVKDDPDFPTGLDTRVQTFTADDGSGRTFARAYDKDKSALGKVVWKEWVRTSYSIEDFRKHEVDPNAHSTHHKFYKLACVDFEWGSGQSSGILGATEFFTLLDNYGSSWTSHNYFVVPYTGKFRMSFRIHFEGYRENPSVLPNGFWRITMIKGTNLEAPNVIRGIWESVPEKAGTKEFKSFELSESDIPLDYNDTLAFKLEWIGDQGDLATAAPKLRIIGNRSYSVFEDVTTRNGTLARNAFTLAIGRLLTRGDVATHVHKGGVDEDGKARTYVKDLDAHYLNMIKKPIGP